jgi:hypothetical protein
MTRKQFAVPDHPWDRAAATELTRINGYFGNLEKVDRGANFFVLALEALGAHTRFSCEGHPTGFYVAFDASYALALELSSAGGFTVEIEGPNSWSIRKIASEAELGEHYSETRKVQSLRLAAEMWVSHFGDRLAGLECLRPAAHALH